MQVWLVYLQIYSSICRFRVSICILSIYLQVGLVYLQVLVFRQESGHFKIRLFYSKSYRTAFGG
ncbi:hypothetical protein, partial [Cytobacillus firmus]|uniref:hypothetical protein n=1 Tax=Cytobacillus firmus TaxID=1399 RepID=UPI001C2E5E51